MVICLLAVFSPARADEEAARWSDSEIRLLKTLSIDSLPPVAADRRNPLAGNRDAVALGKRLFSDVRLSGDGTMSCQSCHAPERFFQDGLTTSKGRVILGRNAPSLVGVAHVSWLYWDGRKDSLWAQALEPIESIDEMNGTRAGVARLLAASDLRAPYERVFGPLDDRDRSAWPSRASPLGGPEERAAWTRLPEATRERITKIFVNVGIAIAAFEATLELPVTRFDRFVRALAAGDAKLADRWLDTREQRGLERFISGDSGCVSCHLGPRFTTDAFHNVGTGPDASGGRDPGRLRGRERVRHDEFNCRSRWSKKGEGCHHLDTLDRVEVHRLVDGGFRTPGLRNLVKTAPYMHDGRFKTLEDVLAHYRSPPDKTKTWHEIPRLAGLTDRDAADIIAFLRALSPP